MNTMTFAASATASSSQSEEEAMHPWNVTPKEAIQLQKQLRDQVKTHLTLRHPQRIAGVDVAYLPETG